VEVDLIAFSFSKDFKGRHFKKIEIFFAKGTGDRPTMAGYVLSRRFTRCLREDRVPAPGVVSWAREFVPRIEWPLQPNARQIVLDPDGLLPFKLLSLRPRKRPCRAPDSLRAPADDRDCM
jgi:hypothetical protein